MRGWDGYKWSGSSEVKKDKPWFRVREDVKNNLRGNMSFNVLLGCTDHKANNGKGTQYRIIKLAGKSSFRVIDTDDGLVAEVRAYYSIGLLDQILFIKRYDKYVLMN